MLVRAQPLEDGREIAEWVSPDAAAIEESDGAEDRGAVLRRMAKLRVLRRLTDALREDQNLGEEKQGSDDGSGSGDGGTNVTDAIGGRVHGCVGSHWELLPFELPPWA